MLLFGASGHAKVIISCLRANNINISAIFDDDISKTSLWDIDVVGRYRSEFEASEPLIISVGDNRIRQKIASFITHTFGNIFHPTAVVDSSVQIGEGTVIFHNAVIQADAKIGAHVIVNTSSSIDHDCHIADFVHIAPNATLCGGISVGEGTLIGAGSIITPNLKIGKHCLIAAGSVITRHIPDFSIVRGNPGRIIKKF